MNTAGFRGETIPNLIPGTLCFGVFAKDDGSNMDLNDAQVMDLHNKLASMNVQPHMKVTFRGYKDDDGTIYLVEAYRIFSEEDTDES